MLLVGGDALCKYENLKVLQKIQVGVLMCPCGTSVTNTHRMNFSFFPCDNAGDTIPTVPDTG